jgi:hypothetical protein
MFYQNVFDQMVIARRILLILRRGKGGNGDFMDTYGNNAKSVNEMNLTRINSLTMNMHSM